MKRHLNTTEIGMSRAARRAALRSIEIRRAEADRQEAWVRSLHGELPAVWAHYLDVMRGRALPKTGEALSLCDEVRAARGGAR